MSPKYRWFAVVFALSLGIDQATKVWARVALKPLYPNVISVIPGYWEFRYSENPGSAFSLFHNLPGARYLLCIVGLIALGIVFAYLRKAAPEARRLGVELGLLAGGALGNIIDRVAFGRVTDFVLWRVQTHEWPVFNFADAALVLGVIGLLFDMRPDDAKAKKAKARAAS